MEKIASQWDVVRIEGLQQVTDAPILDLMRPQSLEPLLEADQYGWARGWTDNADWLNYGLIYNGVPLSNNGAKCPVTFDLVRELASNNDVVMAGYSLLKGRTGIPPHVDGPPSDKFHVYHLGLSIPDPAKCVLVVDKEIHHHRNGELLEFDDTLPHWAVNATDADRLIFYVKHR